MHLAIKTEVICELSALIYLFYLPFSQLDDTTKRVSLIFPSTTGGVYVKVEKINTLYKYNVKGKLIQSITFK